MLHRKPRAFFCPQPTQNINTTIEWVRFGKEKMLLFRHRVLPLPSLNYLWKYVLLRWGRLQKENNIKCFSIEWTNNITPSFSCYDNNNILSLCRSAANWLNPTVDIHRRRHHTACRVSCLPSAYLWQFDFLSMWPITKMPPPTMTTISNRKANVGEVAWCHTHVPKISKAINHRNTFGM